MDKALRSLVDWYGRVGVDVPALAPPAPAPKKRRLPTQTQSTRQEKATPPSSQVETTTSLDSELIAKARGVAEKANSLSALNTALQNFDAGALSDGARQAVFARGNPEADLMVIGEAPGRDEDIQGKPFIGRSGQLLDHMLAAIGLTEDQFYVTNVVNWRPPKNRNPKPDEITLCRPFLDKHIILAQPKILLLVGGVSMTALTQMTGIMKNHGQWNDVSISGQTFPAMPLYHPAFLLRQPALKKDAWRDLLSLRTKMQQIG